MAALTVWSYVDEHFQEVLEKTKKHTGVLICTKIMVANRFPTINPCITLVASNAESYEVLSRLPAGKSVFWDSLYLSRTRLGVYVAMPARVWLPLKTTLKSSRASVRIPMVSNVVSSGYSSRLDFHEQVWRASNLRYGHQTIFSRTERLGRRNLTLSLSFQSLQYWIIGYCPLWVR